MARFCRLLDRVRRDRRGNIMMIFAFASVPLICATGMAVDYANATRIQSRLSAAADAAVLAATSQQMMSQSTTNAAQRAKDIFKITAGTIAGLTINTDDTNQLAISVIDTPGASNVRNASVTFRGTSSNAFGGILGLATLPVVGTAGSTAKVAPDIDFYVLLDTSGSMNLPSTSAGLKQMTGLTGGCAFACHSINDSQAKNKQGQMTDYYGVARSYNILLRSDEAKLAIKNMMIVASSTASANNAAYRAALYSFAAYNPNNQQPINSYRKLANLTSTLSDVGTASDNAPMSLYYANNCPTSNYCNNDQDTASSDAFNQINTVIPSPGNGTRISGDKPQTILFVITDGMRDENRPGGKPEAQIDVDLCSTIKNRSIKIAVLYTEYLPESLANNQWSIDNVLPNLPKVEPALTNCASPGLYQKVSTDGDISAALSNLFSRAVQAARLTR